MVRSIIKVRPLVPSLLDLFRASLPTPHLRAGLSHARPFGTGVGWLAGTSALLSCVFPVEVKVKVKINVKGVGQECPTHTGKVTNKVNGNGRGRPLHTGNGLREFEAGGLAEQVPGFAVGIVDMRFAAAFGA